jgi:hypothetical protein
MKPLDEEQKKAIHAEFTQRVNLSPAELEEWLETKESNSVGDTHTRGGSGGESTGHKSGRRILEIERKKKAALSDDDYQHMRKVIGYVHRHLAQRPANENPHGKWRYSLMNWGHDPFKDG